MKHWGAIGVAALTIAVPAMGGKRLPPALRPAPVGSPAEWFSPADYPPEAIRAARQGRVIVTVGVDSVGKVVTCAVEESSGTTSLDARTCELALQRGQFNPATDRQGRPIASTYLLPVRWVLPDNYAPDVIEIADNIRVDNEFEWVIGADGLVESCKLVGGRLDGATDRCQQWPVGRPWGARYQSAGRPVRAVVRDRFVRDAKVVSLPN